MQEESEEENIPQLYKSAKEVEGVQVVNYLPKETQPIEEEHDASDLAAEFEADERNEENFVAGFYSPDDQRIPIETRFRKSNNREIVEAVNTYSYSDSKLHKFLGVSATIFSFGLFYINRRKVVPAGYWGHYVSSGRHMLVEPGIHTIISSDAEWWDDVLIDDEQNLRRQFGNKTVLSVPENHIAGGYRVGNDEEMSDGEWVLFPQGRHVIDDESYRGIDVQYLRPEESIIKVGPCSVLYVKEGFVGGAYKRSKGKYVLFPPGPPYLLHEREYESIAVVPRESRKFSLGPNFFVTPKIGELAGAETKSGTYRLLPPGQTYMLPSKLYNEPELVRRDDLFSLGPYHFITVRHGQVAGAQLKKGGDYLLLSPGKTYQLSAEEYHQPESQDKNKHRVDLGPLTFLTIQNGTLSGAYRVDDGEFVEFEDMTKVHVLHESVYHGLVTIDKYETEPQRFGPYKVITIPDSYCGVFSKQGKIEINDPGFYKLPSEYEILGKIPLKNFTLNLNQLEFKTRDGVDMSLNSNIVWCVNNPELVAKYPGGFEEVESALKTRARDNLVMETKAYNREQLLPINQDFENDDEEHQLSEQEKKEKVSEASQAAKQILDNIEERLASILREASEKSGWGLNIVGVSLDGLEIKDESTQKLIASRKRAKEEAGEASLRRMKQQKEREENKLKIDMANDRERSEKEIQYELSAIEKTKQAEAETKKAKEEARRAEAELERKKMEKDYDLQQREEYREDKRKEAEVNAEIQRKTAEAEYEKRMKEIEAESKRPQHEIELEKMRYAAEAVKHFGNAAWRHPDTMLEFTNQLLPYLRVSPHTSADDLYKAGSQVAQRK